MKQSSYRYLTIYPFHMKTRTQSVIVVGTLMGVVLILILALTSINYLYSLRNKIKIVHQQDLAKVVILNQMSQIVRERSLRMYAMYFTKSMWARDAEYQRFEGLAREFIELRERLMKIGLQPREKLIWDKAMAIIRVTEPLQDGIVEKLYLGNRKNVGKKIGQDDLPKENRLIQYFDQLLHSVQEQAKIAVAQSQQQFVNAIRLLVLITIGVISLSLTNMFFVRKRILAFEATLYEEKELAQLTLENIVDGVIKTNKEANIISLNRAGEHICGLRESDVLHRNIAEILRVTDPESEKEIAWFTFLNSLSGTIMPLQRYLLLRRADDEKCLIELSVSPIFGSDGVSVEYAFIFRDVTSEKRQADVVSWQATHDPLTQVLNRNAIIASLKEAMLAAREYRQQHVLLFIDLDDFKNVNDQYGHIAGDELLIGICHSMEQCVRKGDRIARMGGDEFSVLLLDCELSHAVNIAEKIRHTVSRYCFDFEGNKVCCGGLSIGIKTVDGESSDWKSILEQADQACYNAKRQGKNQVCVA